MSEPKMYSLDEALKAQTALRSLVGLGPEVFPVNAFVGMISDEIETLRKSGKSDEEIAAVIKESCAIDITADEIAAYYASPEERHRHSE